jgi:hypothetical protein
VIGCGGKPQKPLNSNLTKISTHSLEFNRSDLKLDFQCGYSSYSLFDDSTKIHYFYNQGEILILNMESGQKEHMALPSGYQKKYALWNANVYNINGRILLSTEKGKVFQIMGGELIEIADINANIHIKKRNIFMNPTLGFTRDFAFINESEFIFTTLRKPKSVNQNKSGNYPLFCKYNLKSGKVTFYDYYYRRSYFSYNRPLRTTLFHNVVGDTLMVAYMYSSEVDLFSLRKNKLIGKKNMDSKYQTGEIPFLEKYYSDFEMERYDIETPVYGQVFYNPFKSCYYRVFYHALPEKNENDEYTIQQDKKASIAIYDTSYKWIAEVDINNCFVSGITPTKKGFILNLNDIKTTENKVFYKEYYHDNE